MKKKETTVAAPTTFYVKNMVCDRCIRIVKEEMERIGFDVRSIKLGEVVVDSKRTPDIDRIRSVLQANGFELIDDKNVKVIERIKTLIINLVHHSSAESAPKVNYSEYIASKIGYTYHHLSSLFSSIENITIEKYIILQKIERVKELLVYNELTLSEIAYQMGYSSVQHLSNQFKKVTGFTPSYFRTIKENKRKPLDKVKYNAFH
jgi:AraC-like DNA-binding protein